MLPVRDAVRFIRDDRRLAVVFVVFTQYLGVTLVFMVLPIYAAVERYDFALSEAAADLYASRWQTLTEVVLPVVRPTSMLPPVRQEPGL